MILASAFRWSARPLVCLCAALQLVAGAMVATAEERAGAPETSPSPVGAALAEAPAAVPPLVPGQLTPRRYYADVLSYWQQGPLGNAPIFSPEGVVVADEAAVRLQTDLLRSPDPLLAGATALRLGACNHAAARLLLLAALPTQRDPSVVADLLSALAHLDTTTAAPAVAPLLDHAHPMVRLRAAQLYGRQAAAQPDLLLARARVETDLTVAAAVYQALAAWPMPAAIPPAIWQELAQLPTAQADVRLQWLAAGAFAAQAQSEGECATLATWAQATDPGRRQALAAQLGPTVPPATALTLLTALAQDAHAAVRAAAVRTAGRLARPALAPVLLGALHDRELAVRMEVATQLATVPTAEGYAALVELLGDPASARLRQAATASLVTLAAHYPVAEQLPAVFTSPSALARLHAYQVAAQLPPQPGLAAALRPQLSAETLPTHVVGVMQALIAQHDVTAGAALLARHGHADERVRVEVARAIGLLRLTAAAPQLVSYATHDDSPAVRGAAVTAMGRLPETDFSPTLLMVLQATGSRNNPIDSNARAAACWAAAQAQHLSAAVCNRLLAQLATPVVPTDLGSMYEGDPVRVAAALALVAQARGGTNHQVEVLAQQALAILGRSDDDAASASASKSMPPPASPLLRECAYQFTCFLEHRPPQPHEVPPSAYTFDCVSLAAAPPP